MIPKDTKFNTGETRPPIPEDVYQAEIIDITLQKKPKFKNPTELEDTLTFKFAVIDKGEGYGRWLFRDMRPLVSPAKGDHAASKLYEFLSAIAGRPLTEEECKAIGPDRINNLIGKQVRLTVKVTDSGKNKIDGVMKAKTTLPAYVQPTNEAAHEEDDAPPDQAADDLPF